jgi:hypothetical protein
MKIDGNPSAGILWDQLEAAGIQNAVDVYDHSPYVTVVAIQQKYSGHAKQARHGRGECGGGGAQWPFCGCRRRRHRSDQPERSPVGDDDSGRRRPISTSWTDAGGHRSIRGCRRINRSPKITPTAARSSTQCDHSSGKRNFLKLAVQAGICVNE